MKEIIMIVYGRINEELRKLNSMDYTFVDHDWYFGHTKHPIVIEKILFLIFWCNVYATKKEVGIFFFACPLSTQNTPTNTFQDAANLERRQFVSFGGTRRCLERMKFYMTQPKVFLLCQKLYRHILRIGRR